jgi:energy-coupling factor transport system permease protein
MKRGLHPLSYILICILYSSLAIIIRSPRLLMVLFILVWLLDWQEGSKAMMHRLLGLKKIIWILISIMLIQLLFQREGEIVLNLSIITIREAGWQMARLLGLRLSIIYMVAQSLSKLDFPLFKAAFAKIRLPEELSFMISYMAHLIPQLSANFKAQMHELKQRGIAIRKLPLKEKLEIYKILSIATVAEIILHSRKQAIALELRGFRSMGKRSSLHELSFGVWDLLALIWMLLVIVALV